MNANLHDLGHFYPVTKSLPPNRPATHWIYLTSSMTYHAVSDGRIPEAISSEEMANLDRFALWYRDAEGQLWEQVVIDGKLQPRVKVEEHYERLIRHAKGFRFNKFLKADSNSAHLTHSHVIKPQDVEEHANVDGSRMAEWTLLTEPAFRVAVDHVLAELRAGRTVTITSRRS